MTELVTHAELARIVLDIAKRGHINVAAVVTAADIGLARKFSSYFREAVRGISDEAALKAVKAGDATIKADAGMADSQSTGSRELEAFIKGLRETAKVETHLENL